jgi:hypothetical protein
MKKSRNFGKSNWSWSFWYLKRTALYEEEQIFSWLFEYEEDTFGTLLLVKECSKKNIIIFEFFWWEKRFDWASILTIPGWPKAKKM